MQEFSSISVSTYEPDGLVGQLNEHAADGWEVVAIVPTGSTVTAYLSRAASGDAGAAGDAAAGEPAASETTSGAAVAGAAAVTTPESAASEPAPQEATPEPAPEPAANEPILPGAAAAAEPTPAAEPVAQAATPAVTPAAQAAGGAPAGWYADPSSRFELRYWDGSTWTEHVSRAGQQYTDPPVA